MLQTADFDHNLFNDPYAGDEKIPVQFSMDALKNDSKTEEQGRPIYDEVEFIQIFISKDSIIKRPVRDTDKRRWPRQYAAWKNTGSNEPGMTGTPLTHWPIITRAQVEELRYFKVFTIEQLAEVPDTNVQKIGGIQKLKQQAQAHIAIAREQAPMQHLNNELKVRDDMISQLRDETSALKAQVNELLTASQKDVKLNQQQRR